MTHQSEGADPFGCVEMALQEDDVVGGRRPSLRLESLNCAAESQTRVGLTEFHRRGTALYAGSRERLDSPTAACRRSTGRPALSQHPPMAAMTMSTPG